MIKEIISGKLPTVLNNPTPIALEFGSEGLPDCRKFHSSIEQISDSLQDSTQWLAIIQKKMSIIFLFSNR